MHCLLGFHVKTACCCLTLCDIPCPFTLSAHCNTAASILQKLEHASRSLVNSAAGMICKTESRLKSLPRGQPEVQWGDSQGDEQPGKRQRVASEVYEKEVDRLDITAA